jgi:hypothetical protein
LEQIFFGNFNISKNNIINVELAKVLRYVACNHQSSLIFVIQFHRFLVNKGLRVGHPLSNFHQKRVKIEKAKKIVKQ